MRAIAILVSLLVPGGGHIVLGRPIRGVAWVAGMLVGSASVPWTGALGLVVALACSIGALIDTIRLRPGPRAFGARSAVALVAIAAMLVAYGAALKAFVSESFTVSAASMAPTLLVGDRMMVRKYGFEAHRGQIVVFRDPEARSTVFVKRVVAVGGDSIRIEHGALSLNGRRVPTVDVAVGCASTTGAPCRMMDEEIDGATHRTMRDSGVPEADLPSADLPCPPRTTAAADGCRVDPGDVFVLGDHRDASHDSRFFGAVPLSDLVGVPTVVWLSFTASGEINWPRIGLEPR